MAEFPLLGEHCGNPYCHQLDFLPVRCDACSKTFCVNHFTYEAHSCTSSHTKNVQVPVCPLCAQPVPTPKGQSPDVHVNEHINNLCPTAAKKRIFNNRCTYTGCKKKELVPITCTRCSRNFCLRHRHEKDHECPALGGAGGGEGARPMSMAAKAALARSSAPAARPAAACGQQANARNHNAGLSEDEALARALAASLDTADGNDNATRTQRSSGNSGNCQIS